MTSSTGTTDSSVATIERRETTPTAYAPAAALVAALLAVQSSQIALITAAPEHYSFQLGSEVELGTLVHELAAFHRKLIETQVELPEEAARVLRDNLWQLYD